MKCNRAPATPPATSGLAEDFDPMERAYIRRELDEVLTTLPAASDGFLVRTRKTGPKAGEPKIPPAGMTLLQKRLMRLETQPSPRLLFTQAGWAALKRMMADPHLADPQKFAHVRRELGIE